MPLADHEGVSVMFDLRRLAIGLAALALGAAPAFAADWVPIAPENTLYLQLNKGLVIVELRPDVAPGTWRIKKARQVRLYDGTVFHRVIPGFMAQGAIPPAR
ncbi:MAG: peptidylprolyl isomerase [Alphaproteobacteria bacterium]